MCCALGVWGTTKGITTVNLGSNLTIAAIGVRDPCFQTQING
jgi:hypothetical protein